MSDAVSILGQASGIQWQGVRDLTGAKKITSLSVGLIIGRFRRGSTKPTIIYQDNIKSKLGFDPDNPDYVAVLDAISLLGSVYVMNMGKPFVGISCAGAGFSFNWNDNYFMEVGETDLVTLELNGTPYYYRGFDLDNAFDIWLYNTLYGKLYVNHDGIVYSIRDGSDTNQYRIKIYKTDGVTPMFSTPMIDVGNITYSELAGRIGWQGCIIGEPL